MKKSRPILVAVGAWLVVVALGSALVWAVISRAGEGLVSADPTITADPTTSGAPSPSTSTSTSAPTSNGRVQRTWHGQGGAVVVSCSGGSMTLDSVQPDPGFAVEVEKRGPREVEVQFEGREDESENETKVKASCVAGTPIFEVETD